MENLYNRGVMNAVLITEAIRAAQRLTDKKQVNGDDVRRGLETLSISDARWKELGLTPCKRSSEPGSESDMISQNNCHQT